MLNWTNCKAQKKELGKGVRDYRWSWMAAEHVYVMGVRKL